MTEKMTDIGSHAPHGGDIYRLAEELRIPERKVLDFSSSVNPLGVSKKIKAEIRKHLKYLHNYPDPRAARLRKRLAQYHGIDPEMILCGNGSTELIYLVARALRPQSVLVPAPTFSEYERAVRTAESREQRAEIEYFLLKSENGFEINPDQFVNTMKGKTISSRLTPDVLRSFDMTFLCNPNNPTGRLTGKEDVREIAGAAKDLGCYFVVDEAFIDFCPDASVIEDVSDNPYLIVLRTMSNFYSLAGLRVGYGVFPRRIVDRLEEFREPWTMNNLSQRAAVAALRDRVFREETFVLMQQEKRFLEKSFRKLGLEFFSSYANFYLLKMDSADEVIRTLKTKGILLRDCSDFRGLDSTYLRVAVKSHKDNTVLVRELTAFLNRG
jgi:threonine-phosphate decarboxylase